MRKESRSDLPFLPITTNYNIGVTMLKDLR